MAYNTPKEVREACGLPDEVADEVLERFITKGDKATLAELAVNVIGEVPEGVIDGTNPTFILEHCPLADINADYLVDAYDVKVYKWTDQNYITTKTLLDPTDIDKVYGYDGVITLKTEAVPDPGEKITVDYAFLFQQVDYERVKEAAALMAGYFYVLSEWLLIPDSYALGPLRWKQTYPWLALRREAMRIINEINTGIIRKKEAQYTEEPIRRPVEVGGTDRILTPEGQVEEL